MASWAEQLDITLVGLITPTYGEKFCVVAVDDRTATEIALTVFSELEKPGGERMEGEREQGQLRETVREREGEGNGACMKSDGL